MLSRIHRFAGRASLKFVYKTGRVVRGPNLSIRFVLNQRRADYRVAVVISRKTIKSAVKRNRLRRRIYSTIRRLDISQPFDIVITIFQASALDLAPAALEKQLKSQLQAAGIITKTQNL